MPQAAQRMGKTSDRPLLLPRTLIHDGRFSTVSRSLNLGPHNCSAADQEMLSSWDRTHPGRVDNIGRSINNVTLSHLGDRKLFDFVGLRLSFTH